MLRNRSCFRELKRLKVRIVMIRCPALEECGIKHWECRHRANKLLQGLRGGNVGAFDETIFT